MNPAGDLAKLARKGVELCRRGEWDEGLALLRHVAETDPACGLPGVFYSFLGYGIARFRGCHREGLALCEHSLEVDLCEVENYLNLARTLLLVERRRHAIGVLNRGLALAPGEANLLRLRIDMGVRRAPVVGFLSRSNPLNRMLGMVRHRVRSR